MITSKILSRGGISLRQIALEDCTYEYVSWLNDPEVNQYLETRWVRQTMETIREFVSSQIKNEHSVLFAIVSGYENKHIGNIKIGPHNKIHHHADISYFIGDKGYWGKGVATQAINLAARFGFEEWRLHRVEAGTYSAAVGSWIALEKNGFIREAVLREQAAFNGRYMDVYRYGLLKDEFLFKSQGVKL